MAKYRALLYREWRISRKHHITNFIVLILLAALLDLILLSSQIGNLAPAVQNDDDARELFEILGLYAFPLLIAGASACVAFSNSGVMRADIQSNWLRYSFGLAVTPVMRAAVQYTIILICMVIGYLISMINLWLCNSMYHAQVGRDMYIYMLLFFALGTFVFMLDQYFHTKARNEISLKKQNRRFIGTIAVLYIAAMFAFFKYSMNMFYDLQDKAISYAEEMDAKGEIALASKSDSILYDGIKEHFFGIRDAIAPWIVPVMIVCLALGFFFTVQNYKRREQ